jgi:hypothetical protein
VSRRAIERLQEAQHAAAGHEHPNPVSELVTATARDGPTERFTLGNLMEALGARGHGVLIVLFSLMAIRLMEEDTRTILAGVAFGIFGTVLGLS